MFQTGSQFNISNFKEAEEDSAKFDIFSDNKVLWEPIKEDVKDWLHQNWHVWIAEKQEWFDETKMAAIPRNMIF